jgi:GR25 family glycosyltransferase involved in LPS biosynthesis
MKAYVINLESRTDRWESVVKQWANRPEVLVRIDAVNSISISSAQTQFLPEPVVANWFSQCKAFREFLSTDDQYALIFEDDFLLSKVDLADCLDLIKVGRLDFLQLGYLYNSYSEFLFIKITNFRDLTLKLLFFQFVLPEYLHQF